MLWRPKQSWSRMISVRINAIADLAPKQFQIEEEHGEMSQASQVPEIKMRSEVRDGVG